MNIYKNEYFLSRSSMMSLQVNESLLKRLERQPPGQDSAPNVGTRRQHEILQQLHDLSNYQVAWIQHMSRQFPQDARTLRLLRLRIVRKHEELFRLWYKYRGKNVSGEILHQFVTIARELYALLPIRPV